MFIGNTFVRNVHISDLLESFLVSAVSSILFIRFFLTITGFPHVGGSSLHIAHMLWGGFLLMIAVVMVLSFLGNRTLRIASVIGGIGFGVFIDELGKFITSNNDYFFEPTIALLYIIFLVLFFVFRYIEQHQALTQKEYVMNAFQLFEEVINNDLDTAERAKLLQYIRHAKNYQFADELLALATAVETAPPKQKSRWQKLFQEIDDFFRSFIDSVLFRKVVILFFVLESLVLIANLILVIMNSSGHIPFITPELPDRATITFWGEIISITASSYFVLIGIGYFRFNRQKAYEMFKYSLLISILLTQFFEFYHEQFAALVGLSINLVVLSVINYLLKIERKQTERLQHKI
jgi:hypothetical protein